MIFDACLFSDEHDLFAARVEELEPAVDCFVVVESHHDHQGGDKPLTFDLGRWAGALGDRLLYWTVSLPDPGGHRGGAGTPMYQVRERAQRDATWDAIKAAGDSVGHACPPPSPDDVFLLSDVDEIPTREAVRLATHMLAAGEQEVEFLQRMDCFQVGLRYPGPWRGTTAVRCQRLITGAVTPSGMRDERASGRTAEIGGDTLGTAGSHLTWLGGKHAAMEKQRRFSHAELNWRTEDDFQEKIDKGIDSNGVQLTPVEVDDLYPLAVRRGDLPADWYRPGTLGSGHDEAPAQG